MATCVKFYWLCVKNAWAGSVERANALANILGTIIIWSILSTWGYQLKLPETLDASFFVFEAVFLIAALVAIFIIRLICAPARIHSRLEDEKVKL